MSGWVHRTGNPRELRELEEAARRLGERAPHAPGPTGPVFAKVASVALVATAVLSGALAAVHLWKALFPQHKEHDAGPRPQAAGAGRSPPRHPRLSAPAVAGGDEPHRPHGRSR